jgi:prolyl-tRNA synthetase
VLLLSAEGVLVFVEGELAGFSTTTLVGPYEYTSSTGAVVFKLVVQDVKAKAVKIAKSLNKFFMITSYLICWFKLLCPCCCNYIFYFCRQTIQLYISKYYTTNKMAKNFSSRAENYSQWYNDIVKHAQLAENSSVRGSMVIKPYGYAIWEKMQYELDRMFKETGHENAYFPLFIPKSFFSKEADHVEGFAKECAVVTHYRLKNSDEGIVVDPDAKLEEELIVRPTSETIIWDTYKRWIQSYRDLPILVNQWANVVRWEMRTRLFLRTAEFLWQEGHTAHATEKEALEEAEQMLEVYAEFAEKWMSVPVIKGTKSPNERFAGALETYCIEALMQDGKALQAGTSHFLGQNFAKAFDVKFLSKENKLDYVWATSWGVSTRLIGALIMAHSDDNGLVLPPKLAPIQVVIVPIYRKEEELDAISEKVKDIMKALLAKGISVKFDSRDTHKPGFKFAEYEYKGVPVRLAIGPRDLQNNSVEVARRDTLSKEILPMEGIEDRIEALMEEIQENLFEKAKNFREENSRNVDSWEAFKVEIEKGGFLYAHWDGSPETEQKIKDETKATIRAIPLDNAGEEGNCVYSGKPSKQRVIFARAY